MQDLSQWLLSQLAPVPRRQIASLVGVTERTLVQWSASSAARPSVSHHARLRTVAHVCVHLQGSYNAVGIVRWWDRPRRELLGSTPRQALELLPEPRATLVALAHGLGSAGVN